MTAPSIDRLSRKTVWPMHLAIGGRSPDARKKS